MAGERRDGIYERAREFVSRHTYAHWSEAMVAFAREERARALDEAADAIHAETFVAKGLISALDMVRTWLRTCAEAERRG